jgi:hypothetical protein
MKVIPETRCVSKFHIYVLVMHAIPTFVQIKHKYTSNDIHSKHIGKPYRNKRDIVGNNYQIGG